jgi:hypothetical protein
MRTFGIWTFGLLASLIFGALVGERLSITVGYEGGIAGGLGGMFAFACVRLWLSQDRQISK